MSSVCKWFKPYLCCCGITMTGSKIPIDWSAITDAPEYCKCVDGQTIEAKVVSVYDGDTIKVVFPLNGVLYKWNCRLIGIDTPELRTRDDNEKRYGYFVRDNLRYRILDKVVSVTCGELDKYGRLLTTISIDGNNINEWLIAMNYAFKYDGGTKALWSDYLKDKDMDKLCDSSHMN